MSCRQTHARLQKRRTPRLCAAFVVVFEARTLKSAASTLDLLHGPVDIELAGFAEALVDTVRPSLERTAGRFVAAGQRPGAQRIANLRQVGLVAGERGLGRAARFAADELDRAFELRADRRGNASLALLA